MQCAVTIYPTSGESKNSDTKTPQPSAVIYFYARRRAVRVYYIYFPVPLFYKSFKICCRKERIMLILKSNNRVAKKKDDRIVISHIHACKFRKLLYQKFTGLANRVVWANLLFYIYV